ncbi:hypothetical protein [Ktedonobacter racemifer]|uniref:Uncharacterized protein n=1 Tax=Ktedonobacter racemifer DSM 44963 TaxID=485913 RepID=D6U1U3_KTERA|nr:hypothetical protein [Ktedonobacter racemifer]EFH80827.1 hypothetical protein Krac_1455 [Ktedonobacter racemifer DSM 44963]
MQRDTLIETNDREAQLLEQVTRWVTDLLALEEDTSLLIKQMRCTTPDCPPFRTMIYLMSEGRPVYRYKIHKTLMDITCEDVAALVFIEPKRDTFLDIHITQTEKG